MGKEIKKHRPRWLRRKEWKSCCALGRWSFDRDTRLK
jgi:hypothetical protein